MSRKEKFITVLVPLLLLAAILATAYAPRNENKFQNGYEQGMHHAILYNRTTGEWPSYAWRHEHYNDDLQTEQDIWNTLPSEGLYFGPGNHTITRTHKVHSVQGAGMNETILRFEQP